MTQARWNIEYQIMQETWRTFEPWKNGNKFGFQGRMRIKRRTYEIVVEGKTETYPSEEPKVFISPKPEEHHWHRPYEGEPFLCYQREGRIWQPARSTFASCVAVAVKYLEVFG
jgi:hypothetical protein